MDGNGIPVGMTVFPGNTAGSLTLGPAMRGLKEAYGQERLIVVADKGLNSSANLDRIANGGDGFIVSQPLRGPKGKRYREMLFDRGGYIESADGSRRHKVFEESCEGLDAGGKKVRRRRKVLICWSRAEEARARRKRAEKLERAGRAIRNGAYGIRKGHSEYIREDSVLKDTGELLEKSNVRKLRSVDREKAESDALYDGYFCLITSELDYGEAQIREAYGGLWRIEQSFRVLKSDLYARPVFVWTDAHIRAHFLICFTALLIVRVLQHLMGKRALPADRIATALSAAACQVLKGGIVHLDDVGGAIAFRKTKNAKGEFVEALGFSGDDQTALDYRLIQETFGTEFYSIYPKQEAFNRFLKTISVS